MKGFSAAKPKMCLFKLPGVLSKHLLGASPTNDSVRKYAICFKAIQRGKNTFHFLNLQMPLGWKADAVDFTSLFWNLIEILLPTSELSSKIITHAIFMLHWLSITLNHMAMIMYATTEFCFACPRGYSCTLCMYCRG